MVAIIVILAGSAIACADAESVRSGEGGRSCCVSLSVRTLQAQAQPMVTGNRRRARPPDPAEPAAPRSSKMGTTICSRLGVNNLSF